MTQPKVVLGFVGKLCVGKGMAIDYLVKNHGFYTSSCSDRIREKIREDGLEITRENLFEYGGKLREQFGGSALAKMTWDKIVSEGVEKGVIDSIRAKKEAEFLKTMPSFYLVSIESTPEKRFERMVERKRESDPGTWEDFQVAEEKDNKGGGRDIDACIEMADFRIENNGTQEELYQKIDDLLQNLPS